LKAHHAEMAGLPQWAMKQADFHYALAIAHRHQIPLAGIKLDGTFIPGGWNNYRRSRQHQPACWATANRFMPCF